MLWCIQMTEQHTKKLHERKQIKIFHGSPERFVEDQVNAFLIQRQAKHIHDIKLMHEPGTKASPSSKYSCLIVYTLTGTEEE